MSSDKNILSLQDFWNIFAKQAPAISRLSLPEVPTLIYGLNRFFGNLTFHSSGEESESMIEIICKACKNCTSNRKEYVCETHCGVISGTVEFLLSENVNIKYQPDENTGKCSIIVTRIA